MIRPATSQDAAAIAAIYNHYVVNTVTTFEKKVVRDNDMVSRIRSISSHFPWLVYEANEAGILGYAYANKWKPRESYLHTVEISIYLNPNSMQRGIGTQLYAALIEQLKDRKVHAVIAGIALPNPASIALHEKFGFEPIGRFREVGYKLDRWVDVSYWELLL